MVESQLRKGFLFTFLHFKYVPSTYVNKAIKKNKIIVLGS